MTLVVARQAADGAIRVIADMRLTDRAEIRRGYPYAVLKNIITASLMSAKARSNAPDEYCAPVSSRCTNPRHRRQSRS